MATERRVHTFAALGLSWALVSTIGCASLPLAPRPAETLQPPALTLVEYSDFQCPYAAAGQPIVERLLAVYGQALRYEYRHHTISSHPYAIPAARRYEALRDHDLAAADRLRRTLFHDQKRLNQEGESFLDEVITGLGYDARQIAREAEAPTITERLSAQGREVDAYKLTATPGYILAGVTLQGPTSFEDFEQIVCGEIRRMHPAATRRESAEEPDCWTLVEPDWKRLEELDREAPAAPESKGRGDEGEGKVRSGGSTGPEGDPVGARDFPGAADDGASSVNPLCTR